MKLLSLRKTQLQHKISEAIELGNQDQLLYLRSKLVHRFGIEALEDSEIEINDFLELNSREISQGFSSLAIEQAELPIESSFINDLAISKDFLKNQENLEMSDHPNIRELSDNENKLSSGLVENTEKIPSAAPPRPFVPAPPIPKLSSLRRWLTPSVEEMPKAS